MKKSTFMDVWHGILLTSAIALLLGVFIVLGYSIAERLLTERTCTQSHITIEYIIPISEEQDPSDQKLAQMVLLEMFKQNKPLDEIEAFMKRNESVLKKADYEEIKRRVLQNTITIEGTYFRGKKTAEITGYIDSSIKEPGEFNITIDGLEYTLKQTTIQMVTPSGKRETLGVVPDSNREITVNGIEYTTEDYIELAKYIIEGL